MKFTDVNQIKDFLNTANQCEGDVILTSIYGDRYNLKSLLTQYLAVAALLGEHGNELELFCSNRADEAKFVKFLQSNIKKLFEKIKNFVIIYVR